MKAIRLGARGLLLDKKALPLLIMLMLLTPLLSLSFVEFASGNFDHYFAPKITVISPTTDTVYDKSSIFLSVKVEMQNWNWTDWEELAILNYSLDGQQDVSVPVTNEIKSNDNGLATVNGLATTTIAGVANGAHSLYIHGETTFSQHSSTRTPLGLTIYFIVNAATPNIQVLSPKLTTYTSTSVTLDYRSDKPLSWAGYSLDQNLVVAASPKLTLSNLSNGVHTLRIYGSDSSGKIYASQLISFTINGKKPPSIIIDVEKIVETRKFLPSDFQGNTYWKLYFSVSEPTSWTGYSMDGVAQQTIDGNVTLRLSYGSHTIIVYAKDVCGNIGTSTPYTFVLGPGEAGSAYTSPTAKSPRPLPTLTPQPSTSTRLEQKTQLETFPITLMVISTAIAIITVFTCLILFKHNHSRRTRSRDFD